MKKNKLYLIGFRAFIMLALGIIIFSINANKTKSISNNLYPTAGVIIGIYRNTDTVLFEDGAGQIYSFSGVEDWRINDRIAAIMDNCGTEDNVYDDKIITVRYCG